MLADFKPIPIISTIKGSNNFNINILVSNITTTSFLEA